MTSKLLADTLYALGFLSLFLLLGVWLRAKINLLQNTFLPASVIGGFLLLILGPLVSGLLPIPQDWLKLYALLPGILIVPIVASVPLGLSLKASEGTIKTVLPLAFIASAIGMLQFTLGFATQIAFSPLYDFYPTFGWELGLGYVGGHGTAGLLGNMLQSMNLPYWETAQGVAITTATFGLVGGIIIGMILINWAARKGHTTLLQKPSDIPQSFKVGFIKDPSQQGSIGRETTLSASIDTYAFHSAIILGVCAISYWILGLAKSFTIPIVKDISIWAYCIIVMFLVWGIMCKLNLQYLIDSKVKSKVSGSLTEFAVIAAIASLPLQAVLTYLVPILIMCLLGYFLTVGFLYFMCRYCLKDYWFEQMISVLGMSTGVFLTGVLLLRICDPDFKTPVLANYSLAYTITSVAYFAILNIFLSLLLSGSAWTALYISLALGLGEALIAIIFSRLLLRKSIQ